MAHSLRDLRRVNNALICHPIPPSPAFSYSSRLFSLRSSPIETAFAKIKTLIRKAAARTFHQLWQAVGNVCNIFKEEECYNLFKAVCFQSESDWKQTRTSPAPGMLRSAFDPVNRIKSRTL